MMTDLETANKLYAQDPDFPSSQKWMECTGGDMKKWQKVQQFAVYETPDEN